MLDVHLKLNTRNFERAFHLVPQALKEEFKDALDHISRKFLKEFRAKRLSGPPGVKARPRGLFSHFHRQMSVSGALEDMAVSVYTESKVAKLHESGGIIRDPKGGHIAVPLSVRTEMFTASGALKKRFKNIRNLKNVIALKFGSKIFLARVKKRSREVKPLFVLKKQVVMKKRLGFYVMYEQIKPVFIRILNNSFYKALRKRGVA